MKKADLKIELEKLGAWGLERVTCFDGDPGFWRLVDIELRPLPAPAHPHQIRALFKCAPVAHPRWEREESELSKKLASVIELGGWRGGEADRALAAATEFCGENLLRIDLA